MSNKVLLIGWDAADWKIIGPLLAKGQMPALKSLIDRGVYGNMATMNPPYSPMLWSSVATGKTPDKHGVLGFIEVMPNLSGIQPVTVHSRKAKALWNIFNSQKLKSNLVGWWPSFPAEPINGVIVSDKFQKVSKDPNAKNPFFKGTTHPPEVLKEIKDLRILPKEFTEAHILPFIPNAALIDQKTDKGLVSFSKIMAENTSVHAVATNLMRTTEWDFMGVYYDLIDHFCHAFMKFHPPKLKAIPKDLFQIYKDVVASAYRYQDMMLERTIGLAGKDTTIIVMSDHGYESGSKRILKMPKYPAAPALEHRQFGIFVAAGPNIKKNEKVFGLTLIDVAPTILHMYGLPVGKDMDGKVALDIFKQPKEVKYIESWEDVEGDFAQHKKQEIDANTNQETMQQLIDLGYIEQPDEDVEIAILKTNCDIRHNLARVYLGKKDTEKAKEILEELINANYPVYTKEDIDKRKEEAAVELKIKEGESVVNTIPFYMDLLNIALRDKEFDKADTYLKKLRELDKEFEFNTLIPEAKILLGKGKPKKALQLLEISKRKKRANAQVWHQIGDIHKHLFQYEEAKKSYENALKLELDNAKLHQALAEVLVRLKDYEEAADHALTSIELVKYFPKAHYTLGEALEKMGDLENAKKAYEMAEKLVPKTYPKATQALENIAYKTQQLTDKSNNKYYKNQIIVVSGLPRSGTSLMMQMLHKGGLEVLIDNKREADISNPKGYFEYEPVMSIHKDNSWLELGKDKAVKIVAPLLGFLNSKFRYKVIFMNRDLYEIVKSQQKMIGKDPETLPTKLLNAYKKQLNTVELWKEKEPGVELIYLDYKEVLNNPKEAVQKIQDFIGVNLNKEAMKQCVDVSLYRNKA